MRLLLDTHALLWWWGEEAKLSEAALSAIGNEANEVLVSAATAWEIATKQRLGKLPAWPMPPGGFAELVNADGFTHLPVTAAHAWQAGAMVSAHRDPFDRVLAAQAQMERLLLVTRDPAFVDLRVRTLW